MEKSWMANGPCPFSAQELDGRSVEYEGPDFSTTYGTLWAQQNPQGDVRVELRVMRAGSFPAPVTCDTAFLRRHPKPHRNADFLWAKHPARILASMSE